MSTRKKNPNEFFNTIDPFPHILADSVGSEPRVTDQRSPSRAPEDWGAELERAGGGRAGEGWGTSGSYWVSLSSSDTGLSWPSWGNESAMHNASVCSHLPPPPLTRPPQGPTDQSRPSLTCSYHDDGLSRAPPRTRCVTNEDGGSLGKALEDRGWVHLVQDVWSALPVPGHAHQIQ